jgi:NAD(P)-dependent dehydrogenase (short-subunit alcohol dehydrogenase family)
VKNDVANLRRIVDARLWGLRSVVRHAALRTAQGSITVTRGRLVSHLRPMSAMRAAMRPAVEALATVRINTVTLGLMDTPLLHTAYGAERDTIIKNRAAILPDRRVGTADNLAQVILM